VIISQADCCFEYLPSPRPCYSLTAFVLLSLDILFNSVQVNDAVMNGLDFVFHPHLYITDIWGKVPFTIPATLTETISTATTDVARVTTSPATIASEALAAVSSDFGSTYNTSTPLGFLLYVASQSQKIFFSGSAGGMFFGGPTRSYWMLTLFMVR